MTSAPTLETERLRLRAYRATDFDALASMWADPLVVKHIGGRPSTREETWGRLLKYGGLWPLLGFGYWAVEDRATRRFVGDVGLADFHRDMTPALGDAPEAGWVLASWAHGRGYATEAVGAALSWSDRQLSSPTTTCIIDTANAASMRVAAKCGFSAFSNGELKGSPITLLRRSRG